MNMKKLEQMQKELDLAINGNGRTGRTIEKMKLSIIAEVIEFNEEVEFFCHKDWRPKEFDRKKQLEEFVDILFFLLQSYALRPMTYEIEAKKVDKFTDDLNNLTLQFIQFVATGNWEMTYQLYVKMLLVQGFTFAEIEKEYERKHAVNLNRIKGDWSK